MFWTSTMARETLNRTFSVGPASVESPTIEPRYNLSPSWSECRLEDLKNTQILPNIWCPQARPLRACGPKECALGRTCVSTVRLFLDVDVDSTSQVVPDAEQSATSDVLATGAPEWQERTQCTNLGNNLSARCCAHAADAQPFLMQCIPSFLSFRFFIITPRKKRPKTHRVVRGESSIDLTPVQKI